MFLENSRLPGGVAYGAAATQRHAVEITTTAGGGEYRRLRHPFVQLALDVSYTLRAADLRAGVLSLYSQANGSWRGFRVRDITDCTTNNYVQPPTALDQPAVRVSAGVYQLMRWYGDSSDPVCARRRIRKPVPGTVLVAVSGVVHPVAQWSVDTSTGLVSMADNKAAAISGISRAAQAVLTVAANTLAVGDSVVISGLAGMTQINGRRALIVSKPTATQLVVDINSTGFGDYLAGGTVQTSPLDTEQVTAGCEFDIPCRFDSELDATHVSYEVLEASGLNIIEILNP